MYQHTGYGPKDDYFFVTCIKINSALQKHTIACSGFTKYYGNFALWQGSLDSGTYDILVEYRNRYAAQSNPHYWQTRALTIVHC